ncbi:MAG: hypothetical protein RI567_00985 [Marinobacter sp.]|nr:hypothetical protein [Marinobacter sp.]
MFGRLLQVLFLTFFASLANAEQTKVLGLYLGMSFDDAVEELKDRAIFQRTTWDGSIVLGGDRHCGSQLLYGDISEPCFGIRADASKLKKNDLSKYWKLSSISYAQNFDENIHVDLWKSDMSDRYGSLTKFRVHKNTVQGHEREYYVAVLEGKNNWVEKFRGDGSVSRKILEEMIGDECSEVLKYVLFEAYVKNDMVFGFTFDLKDMKIACAERIAIEKNKKDSSVDALDQIKLD